MLHKVLGEYLRCNIRKNSLHVRGELQKRVISSPVQKSPSGYRHAGEASLWLCSEMQVRQWRRNLKDNGADSTFSFHLLLHFGTHPSFWFSPSLPAMVVQAGCASLCLSLRRYQAEAAWESEAHSKSTCIRPQCRTEQGREQFPSSLSNSLGHC